MENKGLRIIYKSGGSWDYDPIVNFEQTTESLNFNNGYFNYVEPLEYIESWNFYDLCEKCKYELNYCRCDENN